MKRLAIVAAAGLASMASAVAQTPPPNSLNKGAAANKSLSRKLSESNGVIKPKANVDPGIHVTAPDPHPNAARIIPPSSTGGGSAK